MVPIEMWKVYRWQTMDAKWWQWFPWTFGPFDLKNKKKQKNCFVMLYNDIISFYICTCSVSTKLATCPSSLAPLTLNLVPALSQLRRDIRQAFACLWEAYMVLISTPPQITLNNHWSQSIPNLWKCTCSIRFLKF